MRSINEKCAVVAVSNQKNFDVSRLVYLGLWSLQHRGQDSSGIASFNGSKLHTHTGMGLVSQVYSEESLAGLKGQAAIGHNRYSTSGGNDEALNQPYSYEAIGFALAHNGNLPYVDKLKTYANDNGLVSTDLNDTGLMGLALSNELRKTGSITRSLRQCWPLFTGAFSCVGIYKEAIFAFRDEHGIRPLAIGKTTHGYVVASETVALDIIGADYLRDVRPGELVILRGDKLESVQIVDGQEQVDAFEFVYLARPDSSISGQSIYHARYRAGEALAKVAPVDADVVIGVPDSGVSAATGYSHASGIRFEPGLIKNRYIGRTFIEPDKIRKSSVELKFNVISKIVAGKDILLVDDSLVRGNTLPYVVEILKKYSARSVHIRIASPPILYPDFYGVDTPDNNDLIASHQTVEQMITRFNADSLAYLPLEDFIKTTGLPKSRLCLSGFNGDYPIPVPLPSPSA
ncbi:MAG: amidophosphoribosyltransferase [Candidatus Saccharimonadales bacterium]